MPNAPASHDETVARLALDRMVGEAKAVAGMRGMPPGLRFATPEEELALFNKVDDEVDPRAVLAERLQKHLADGHPPDAALTEAVLETAAVTFPNRLKMAQGGGRITLTEQCAYLENLAQRTMAARAKMSAGEVAKTDQGAANEAGAGVQGAPDARLTGMPVQPSSLNLGTE